MKDQMSLKQPNYNIVQSLKNTRLVGFTLELYEKDTSQCHHVTAFRTRRAEREYQR